jgi:hypothetical protein
MKRRKRVDENDAVQEWMRKFIEDAKERYGVEMTMDQASDAFVKWAFSGTKPGEVE